MLNVAQIGVGYWGPNLLRNLVANKGCRVSTVADLSPERRKYVRGMYPAVKVTEDIDEVLHDPGIEAVVIATPVATHFDLAIRALSAGKHIFIEKPMARSVAEVDEIGRLATERKRVAMVGHTFLFNSAVRYVKKLIDSGELGDIRRVVRVDVEATDPVADRYNLLAEA